MNRRTTPAGIDRPSDRNGGAPSPYGPLVAGRAERAICFLLVGEGCPMVRLKSGGAFGFDNPSLPAKMSEHSVALGLPPRLVALLHPRPNRTASPGCAVLFCILVCSLCVR